MSSLVHYEPFVDQCAEMFNNRLIEFTETKKSLNLGHWFQCYAFDVIGNITFGDRFGKSSPCHSTCATGYSHSQAFSIKVKTSMVRWPQCIKSWCTAPWLECIPSGIPDCLGYWASSNGPGQAVEHTSADLYRRRFVFMKRTPRLLTREHLNIGKLKISWTSWLWPAIKTQRK